MSKFKVGDRVRCFGRAGGGTICNGEMGTVMEESSHPWIRMDAEIGHTFSISSLDIAEGYGLCFSESNLELVSDKPDDCEHIRELAEIASYYGVDIRIQTGDVTTTITSKTKYQDD